MTIADWLRLLFRMLHAPMSALREVRDRASLASAGLVGLITTAIFFALWIFLFLQSIFPRRGLVLGFSAVIQAASFLVLIAVFVSPIILVITNLFERRGSFRLLLQQEYVPLTSSLFFAMGASSCLAAIISVLGKFSGVQDAIGARLVEMTSSRLPTLPPEMAARFDPSMLDPEKISAGLSPLLLFALFHIWSLLTVRVIFRLSWFRCVVVMLFSGALLFAGLKVLPLIGVILASPFLLLLLFLLLRGYVSDLTRTHRARESFKQNLEAATLNPADASAHYNLGLIHQQRGELQAARERFERALQIDEEEIDSHYQLGRIARQQKRWADAIRHFEQVVSRDQYHAQNEIWREVGATYVAAGQFGDAIEALKPFIERRPSDPQALYLLGRAHAGLGHKREATSSMQACIEAVKTAPAYKYRAEKRWLNEAQQFLRTQA